jgi:hypothetical protein
MTDAMYDETIADEGRDRHLEQFVVVIAIQELRIHRSDNSRSGSDNSRQKAK